VTEVITTAANGLISGDGQAAFRLAAQHIADLRKTLPSWSCCLRWQICGKHPDGQPA